MAGKKNRVSEYYTVVQVCMKSTTLKRFEEELEIEQSKPFNRKSGSKILFERLERDYKNNPIPNSKR